MRKLVTSSLYLTNCLAVSIEVGVMLPAMTSAHPHIQTPLDQAALARREMRLVHARRAACARRGCGAQWGPRAHWRGRRRMRQSLREKAYLAPLSAALTRVSALAPPSKYERSCSSTRTPERSWRESTSSSSSGNARRMSTAMPIVSMAMSHIAQKCALLLPRRHWVSSSLSPCPMSASITGSCTSAMRRKSLIEMNLAVVRQPCSTSCVARYSTNRQYSARSVESLLTSTATRDIFSVGSGSSTIDAHSISTASVGMAYTNWRSPAKSHRRWRTSR
mmetsp:Transcript_25703/g.66468  ORF Transcript_25703/g.66468 Transcript_25703/m.66468 type:complete len:277 (+) Transcript_25703:24-854(+)